MKVSRQEIFDLFEKKERALEVYLDLSIASKLQKASDAERGCRLTLEEINHLLKGGFEEVAHRADDIEIIKDVYIDFQ